MRPPGAKCLTLTTPMEFPISARSALAFPTGKVARPQAVTDESQNAAFFSNRIGTVLLFIHQLTNNHVFNSPVSLREPPSLLGRASAPSGRGNRTSFHLEASV